MLNLKKRSVKENIAAYIFVAPGLLLFAFVGLYTIIMSIVISFYNWNGVDFGKNARFVGFNNFKSLLFYRHPLLTDTFYHSLFNNFKIAFFTILFVIPIAMVLAYFISQVGKLAGIFRMVYFIPMVTAGVAIYYTWIGIFAPDGALNGILQSLGLHFLVNPNGILGDTKTALFGVIMTVIWSSIPGAMIFFYAGITSIDKSLYDAAEIDGATKFRVITSIVWPLLKPITVVVIFLILNTSFQMFENVFILTRGGPANSTSVTGMMIYGLSFDTGVSYGAKGFGFASAAGWSVFLVTFSLSLLSRKLLKTNY